MDYSVNRYNDIVILKVFNVTEKDISRIREYSCTEEFQITSLNNWELRNDSLFVMGNARKRDEMYFVLQKDEKYDYYNVFNGSHGTGGSFGYTSHGVDLGKVLKAIDIFKAGDTEADTDATFSWHEWNKGLF